MAESLYRRKPEGNVIGRLQERRKFIGKDYVQTKNGKSGSVRNPCFISITGIDKSCVKSGDMTLPHDESTWDLTYKPSIKPGPDLDTVTIEYGGDWGLARKISATIRCYKISDFEEVQKKFLMPGNEISTTFGYKDITWGVPESKTLSGFKVATFAFNTTQEGHWIASFTAVSSATAIKNLDMQLLVKNSGDSIVYMTGKDLTKNPVKGIAQLITSDSQKNGQYSIDDIKDGDVIEPTVDYSPGSIDTSAACVVYNGDHLRDTMGKFKAWAGGIAKDLGYGDSEVETANNQVYVTVGYIVNRVINDQLLRNLASCVGSNDKPDFDKLKVEFSDKYSKCKIAPQITSGDPVSVLLLGNANYKNTKGDGKDFDKDCQQLGKVKSHFGGDIKIQNILVHRDVVSAAFTGATKQREAESDNADVKDSKEEVINIIDFFDKVSDHISSAVGGAISLRLVDDPDDLTKLIVVDQNYGVASDFPVVVFDPIDGDGSTRSCEVQSNVGSQEYKAAMFVGSSKKGDPVSVIKGCYSNLETVKKQRFGDALDAAFAIVGSPGNLGTNHFNGQEINALKSAVCQMYKNAPDSGNNETIHYPGLSISVDIDGTWGFIPGNGISSTQVPRKWREAYKSYFMVTSIVHSFSQSDWSTKISGILSYYPKLSEGDYVKL